MAVHLPLSAEAQAEARILMLSSNNILKPADGRPVTMPTQDMIIGLYHLTLDNDENPAGQGRSFSSISEAIMAFDAGALHLQARIKLRFEDVVPPRGWEAPEGWTPGDPLILETSLGRACSTRRCRRTTRSSTTCGQEGTLDDRQRPRRAVPEGRRGRHAGRLKRPVSTGPPGPG